MQLLSTKWQKFCNLGLSSSFSLEYWIFGPYKSLIWCKLLQGSAQGHEYPNFHSCPTITLGNCRTACLRWGGRPQFDFYSFFVSFIYYQFNFYFFDLITELSCSEYFSKLSFDNRECCLFYVSFFVFSFVKV